MIAVIDADEKECRVCHEILPLTNFDRRRDTRDRHAYICKACHAAEARERGERRKAEADNDDVIVSPGNPYVYLARSVIKFAVRDYKRRNAKRGELLAFFRSPLFEDWADMAGVNPDVVRERLGIAYSPTPPGRPIYGDLPVNVTEKGLR